MPPTRQPATLGKMPRITRRQFLAGSIATAAAITLYADEFGRHELSVTNPTFYLRNLPPAFHGFRIVQFSDIHLEEFTEEYFLNRVIARVNALDADLVLVTGDFCSRGPMSLSVSLAAAARCAQLLTALTCPVRYGVLGNHDVAVGARDVRSHLEANGLPILINQHVRIERDNQHFYLSGVNSMSAASPNLTTAVPDAPDAPVLLMAHEPDYADHVANHPKGSLVDLIFSGHTHGGQIRIPGLRPLALPPFGRRYPEGHYLVGSSQLYVNRGIGTVGLPLRLNCPPEITVATLQPMPTDV